MSLALRYNPGVVANEAQRQAARAGERTAAAYPNPVVEAGAGPTIYRDGRNGVNNNWGSAYPSRSTTRPARLAHPWSRSGTGAAQAGLQGFK